MALQRYADQPCPQWDVDAFDINDLYEEPMNVAIDKLATHKINKNLRNVLSKVRNQLRN